MVLGLRAIRPWAGSYRTCFPLATRIWQPTMVLTVHLYPKGGGRSMSVAQKRKILIWGKTAPELSMKYYETVCTGGVLEDGTPVRLYPIPYRYMADDDKFKKYQ